MLARILLPHLAPNLPRATMGEWLVIVGDEVGFGDAICRVNVKDRVLIRGTKWASSLLAHSRRAEAKFVAYEEESGLFETSYVIVASEPAKIHRHSALEGEAVQVGDLIGIAVLGSIVAAQSDSAVDELPVMRVIARLESAEYHE